MRKLTILVFLALAIAALPLIGTTAEDEVGDVESTGASSDAAASGCENISLGSFEGEDIDADVGYDEGPDDADTLNDFTDYSLQEEEAGDVMEMELQCEPPNPDNTVICYDGDTPLNCNIVDGQYICP